MLRGDGPAGLALDGLAFEHAALEGLYQRELDELESRLVVTRHENAKALGVELDGDAGHSEERRAERALRREWNGVGLSTGSDARCPKSLWSPALELQSFDSLEQLLVLPQE